jgi:single-stranded DNA-specific DHH superfamily exonuclease
MADNIIIHHWDTDGICSAAIVAMGLEKKGESWINYTLQIGKFEFDKRVAKEIEEANTVYIVDLNMPEAVEKLSQRVIFIDHHIQKRITNPNIKQVNPIISGRSEKEFPSATWVVSHHFSIWNYLSALGAVGDVGSSIFDWPIGKKVEGLLNKEGLSKDDAVRLVSLLDSNYIAMDRQSVEEAVSVILNSNPKDLLENRKWNHNVERIGKEIERAFSGLNVKGKFAEIEFESDFNIISYVARKAVWEMNFDAALVVNRNFNGRSQVYFRIKPELTTKYDLPKIIKKLKASGFNAGGKKEVFGVVCPKSRLEEVLSIIKSEIR